MTGDTLQLDTAENLEPQISEAIARPRTDGIFSNWRNLIREIAVVVVGILLALWADQTMDGINTRQQVSASIEMTRRNARALVYAAAMRDAMSPCIGRRLAAVSTIIDDSSRSGRLPAVGQLGAPGFSAFNFSVGDRLLASETAAQLDQRQIGYYVTVSTVAAGLRAATAEELSDWSALYTMVGPGRRFSDVEQTQVRAALSRAVGAAKRLKQSAQSLTAAVAEAGLMTPKEISAERKRAGGDYAQAAREGIMCKPLADAPRADAYGQAPSPVDLLQAFKP